MQKVWQPDVYDSQFGFVSDYGQEILKILDPQPNEKILDLGCGTGRLTDAIAQSGALVTGMDLDISMLARAKEMYPNIRFEEADAHFFKTDARFDAVFSNAALHWMTRPSMVLERVSDALRTGGRFVAEMGAKGNVQIIITALRDALDKLKIEVPDLNHIWYFPSVAEYCQLLEQHSFHIDFVQHFPRRTPLPPGKNGLKSWVRMFASPILGQVSNHMVNTICAEVERSANDRLFEDGRWFADYQRLRFGATRI
jgi:trans-aconitate methyltransferase